MNTFSDLLIENIPHLRRYARSLTQDLQQSEDLVQDCLDRAWSRQSQWQKGSNIRAWLFTILHNLHVNTMRNRHRTGDWETYEPMETADLKQPGQEGMLQLRDLETALLSLTDGQREILMLVCVEGMSYEEVSQVLGIALGTVMSRLHRARESLRRTLRGEEPPKLRRVK